MRTLIDLLQIRASDIKTAHGYSFLTSNGEVTANIGYADVLASASVIACSLQEFGVKKGDPVLLPLPLGDEFLAALFGTMMIGGLAVPVPRANGRRAERRLLAIAASLGHCTLLCRCTDIPKLKAIAGDGERIRVLGIGEPSEIASSGADVETYEDDACIIQYTSGSTGMPHGVVLTHRNIMEQQRILAQRFAHNRDSRILTWLPPFHDMGLIGGLLQPLYVGAECFCMPTAAFLRQPASWPTAISRHRCTTSGGPDFAFAMCAERTTAEERATLDLSCWAIAFNGADHVLASTLDRFAEVFGPHGFQRRAFFPCYGLAEASLMVSGGGNVRRPPLLLRIDRAAAAEAGVSSSERPLVGCGEPIRHHDIEIVDPGSGSPVGNGSIGEIWISGPTVARGYWNDPVRTAAVFGAHLSGRRHPFLRTGDLGLLRNGELFVLGRIDDLIVWRGENLNPLDIEAVAAACPEVDGFAGAAFLDDIGVVLVQEIRKRAGGNMVAAAASVRTAVWHSLELNLVRIVLVRSGALPRTTSGKIERGTTRRLLRDGMLRVLHDDQIGCSTSPLTVPAVADRESLVWHLLARFVPANAITLESRLLDLGFDSLSLTHLQARLAQIFCVEFPTEQLYANPTVAELTELLPLHRQSEARLAEALNADTPKDIPLTSSQRVIVYSEELFPGDPFYHVGVMLRLGDCYDRDTIARAANSLVTRHEALRAALVRGPSGLALRITPAVGIELEHVVIDSAAAEDIVALLAKTSVVRPFDLSTGRNCRFVLIQMSSGERILVIVIHHIVCDGWAMRILLRDLHALLMAGSPPALPNLPAYGDVAGTAVRAELTAEKSEQHRKYWTSIFAQAPAAIVLPTDHPRPKLESRAGARVSGKLKAPQWAALQRLGRELDATAFMILAGLLSALIHRWTGSRDFVVGTAVANRREEDQMEVVGCFTNFVPIRIRMDGQETLGDVLRGARDAIREALSHQNYPYDMLVKLLNPPRTSDRKPLFSVGLWYHAYPLQLTESAQRALNPEMLPTATSDLDVRVVAIPLADASLDVVFEYKTSLFEATSISRLLNCLLHWADGIQGLVGDLLSELPALSGPRVTDTPAKTPQADEIVIVANFAAEEIDRYLTFWLSRFGRPARITRASFNDICLPLVDCNSAIRNNAHGLNLILVDPAAWHRDHTADQAGALAREAAKALLLLEGSSTTTIVATFPATDSSERHYADETAALLAESASRVPGMSFCKLDDVAELYNVRQIRLPDACEVEPAAFSREFFAAAGTKLARAYLSHLQPRSKAIIVDCDGTLWDGICGEDRQEDIVITAGHAALQRFLVEQKRQGILICLCSRNNESDIRALFNSGLSGPLTFDDVAATRINWEVKAANIISLAEELKLDPTSFVFLDDDPFECEQVRARLPMVITLNAGTPGETLAQLKHLWTLDVSRLTEEDSLRTSRLKEERKRNEARLHAPDIGAYIESLAMSVDIRSHECEDLERVSQLSRRITQFTASARAWSAAALAQNLQEPARACFTVRVSDRFGNYGLVGAMIVSYQPTRTIVTDFFLSCRVLGRGVEEKMVHYLACLALRRRHPSIEIVLSRTDRNIPARAFFLGSNASEDKDGSAKSLVIEMSPADLRERCSRNSSAVLPMQVSTLEFERSGTLEPKTESQPQSSPLTQRRYERICMQFRTAHDVMSAVDARPTARGQRAQAFVPSSTDTERAIAAIWSRALHVQPIGANDNFFDLGGHSMQMIYILKEINDTFGIDCSLIEFMESLTVAAAAALVDAKRSCAAIGSER
jgi:FkbH-like protein